MAAIGARKSCLSFANELRTKFALVAPNLAASGALSAINGCCVAVFANFARKRKRRTSLPTAVTKRKRSSLNSS